MAREETKPDDFENLNNIVQSDCYDIGQRLIFVSHWLQKCGLSQEAIMLGYFNECMRVATENGSIMGSYITATRLQAHVARLVEKLHAAAHAVFLEEPAVDRTTK